MNRKDTLYGWMMKEKKVLLQTESKQTSSNDSEVKTNCTSKKVRIDALDQISKDDRKMINDKNGLFRIRKLLIVTERRFTDEHQDKMEPTCKVSHKSDRSYRMVSLFEDFHLCETVEEAEIPFPKLYY